MVLKMTSGILHIFSGVLQSLKIRNLMGSFFVKSRKCMSLKFTEEFSVISKKNDAKFLKEFDLSLLNWHDKVWRILTLALESLKNLHFNGFFLTKVCNSWAKKAQRSYLLWHWRMMKNLKKNWLVVWKMTSRI